MKLYRDQNWFEGVDEKYETDTNTGEVCFTRTIYYYNTVTNEASYEKPSGFSKLPHDDQNSGVIFSRMKQAFEGKLRLVNKDHRHRVKSSKANAEQVSLGCVWLEIYDVGSLSVYYYNKATQQTQWHRPHKNIPVCVMEDDEDFLSAVIKVQTLYRMKMQRMGTARRIVNKNNALRQAELRNAKLVGDLLCRKKQKKRLQFSEANSAKGWELLEEDAQNLGRAPNMWRILGNAHAKIACFTRAKFHFEEAYYSYRNSFACDHNPVAMLYAARVLRALGKFRSAAELLGRVISGPSHNTEITLAAIFEAAILLCHPSCLSLKTAKSYILYVVEHLETDVSINPLKIFSYPPTWMNFIFARILERDSPSKEAVAVFGETQARYSEAFRKLLKEQRNNPMPNRKCSKLSHTAANIVGSSRNALRWMFEDETWGVFAAYATMKGDHALAADAYMKILLLSYSRSLYERNELKAIEIIDGHVKKDSRGRNTHRKDIKRGKTQGKCKVAAQQESDEKRFHSRSYEIVRGNNDDVLNFKNIVNKELEEVSLENEIILSIDQRKKTSIFGIEQGHFLQCIVLSCGVWSGLILFCVVLFCICGFLPFFFLETNLCLVLVFKMH